MTDSTDPNTSDPRRKKTAREPATIDLKATVVGEGSGQGKDWDRNKGSTQASGEASGTVSGEDTFGPEKTAFGGAGTPPDQGSTDQSSAKARDRFGLLVGAGVVGGLVGAGIVLGVQTLAPVENPRLVQVENRMEAIEKRTQVGVIDDRLLQLEQAVGNLRQSVSNIRQETRRAERQARSALDRPIPVPPPQDNAPVAELENRLAALEAQLQTYNRDSAEAVAAVRQRADEQANKVAALSGQISSNVADQAQAQASVRIALADRLIAALRQGAPYAETLDALRKVENDEARLAPLTAFAKSGAPTAASLAASFKPLAAQIVRENRTATGGWSDWAQRLFDRVVTIRPVDAPNATNAGSLVARIEDALARGDVRAAYAAWETLPEPSRRLSQDWGRLAKQRADADRAADALASDALTAIDRPAQ